MMTDAGAGVTAERDRRYQAIFRLAPVSLWEEDFTGVVVALEAMKAQGVTDFREHLRDHPEVLADLASKVKVVDVNQYTLELFGAGDKDELLGALDKVFVPETYPVFLEQIVTIATGNSNFTCESYVGTLQGRRIYIYMTLTKLPPVEGLHLVLVTVMDISRRKQAEDKLAAQRKLYRTLTESTPHMVWMSDTDEQITYCNQAMQEMLGISLQQVRGRDWAEAVHPDDLDRILKARRNARDQRTMYRGECMFRSFDGTYRSVYFIDTPVKDHGGVISNWVGVSTDITELKRAQAQIEKSLDRSNQELNQLTDALSHDLREPLRMVTSYSQLLHRRYSDSLGEQADKYIGYIIEGADRIDQILRDLRELSNVGTSDQALQSCDTNQIITELLPGLLHEFSPARADVVYRDLPTLMARRQQMVLLFHSLMHNSLKFRAEAEPKVKISARRDGITWLFTVEDNGIGFDTEAYGERVFQMFRRLHTRDRYPGNGIGLTIAKKIVERHGGRIWVNSQPGHGTILSFTLPAVALE